LRDRAAADFSTLAERDADDKISFDDLMGIFDKAILRVENTELTGTFTDYAGRCSPPGGVGDSCDHDCGPGLFCRHTPDYEPFWGYCEVIVTDGGECPSDYGCSTTYCGGVCIEVEPADTWCSMLG